MSFNTYGRTSKIYGGHYPVWRDVKGKITAGGTIPSGSLDVGTIIPAGTPVYIAQAGAEVKILEFYKVTAVDGTAKKITVLAGSTLPLPKVGEAIMVTPSTWAGTGQSQVVSSVTVAPDGATADIVTATALTCVQGDIITLASGTTASATATMAVTNCNALTENDVYIEEGTYAATCAGVFEGVIWEDRITPLPMLVKSAMPNIFFQAGI